MSPDQTPLLLQPLQLGPVRVRNRAWVSPMCQYSAEGRDGIATDWHLVHYGGLALGGWGMVVLEATAVSPEGRISPWDLGLWDDAQVPGLRRITDFCHRHGATAAVQLGHAGRKASTTRWFPTTGHAQVLPADGGWLPVGPTTARGEGGEYTSPVTPLDEAGIARVVEDFAAAAHRATVAGFDAVDLHAAHGYLLHQFCSPLSNARTDRWGGAFDNRVRLVLDVVDAVREAFAGALLVRISATDWHPQGWQPQDSVRLARLLDEHGVDLVDVSTGGNCRADIPVGPGYQVPFAEQVRREAGVATSAVGLLTTPQQAEQVLAEGAADAVMLGREALRDPNWALRAAHELGLANDLAPWPEPRWRGMWR